MKLILFDFDGVMVHTHITCYEIHQQMNPDIKYDFFQSLSRGNFLKLYTKAEKENKIVGNPNFHSIYRDRLSGLEIPPELKKLIIKLSDKYPLLIVSSTSSGQILSFLEKESMADKFKAVLGSDIHTSKTEKIKNILAEYDVSSKDVVFVTDTTGDIMEAREAGVDCIGVTWGLHDKKDFLEEKPFGTADTPSELEEKIEEFFKK